MIDKSTRQYYASGQLVKPTRHGLRPGYRGDAAYGGPDPGHGQASGGNGGNAREQRISQQYDPPAPVASPRDKREQGAIKSLEEAMEIADKTREEEALKNKIIDEARERRMGLEGKTGVKDTSLDRGEGFGTVDRSKVSQFSEYGRNRMIENLQPKSFFDSGLGKVVKNIGLGFVAPHLLAATPLAKPYSMYTTANRVSALADVLGWGKPKEIMSSLTSNLTTPKGTIDTTPKGDRNNREQGIMQAQAPKDIVSKGVERFSPEHLNLLHKRYAELQEVIKSGEYMGQKLNNNQLATLTQTSKQMKDFLVSEVGGMRLT